MKSLKVINKRKKYFTQKKRNSDVIHRELTDSLINSKINTIKSQYKLSLNKSLPYYPNNAAIEICNLREAFRYESKLKYKINKICYDYDNTEVKKYLLNKLNTPIHISQIIPPKQIDGNCWFNSMFMMFFISDKGRVFFQYLRLLMIEGNIHGKIKIENQELRNISRI